MPDQNDVVPVNVPVVVPGESDLQHQLEAIRPEVAKASGSRTDTRDPVMKAKQLVTDNYNRHRNADIFPAMTVGLVNVLWFTSTRNFFKATCEFTVVYGFIYVVSYNSRKREGYIEVFKKQSAVKLENVL